jgi:hypothetical protein
MKQRASSLPRTKPFGTRTFFAKRFDRVVTALSLSALRAIKPETDAHNLGSLHFAYWVLLPRELVARGKPQAAQRDEMLFLSDFSGDWEVYLVGFNRVLLSALDAAWGRAVDWVNDADTNTYLRFVRRYQLQPQYYVSPYTTRATVDDVRRALSVSDQLERFAWDTQGVDQERFGRLFDELCTRLGSSLAA